MVGDMQGINAILGRLARHLFAALAAHVHGDRDPVEAVLERASIAAHDLMDAVGGVDGMGTIVGEGAMAVFSEIESLDLSAPSPVVFDSLTRAIAGVARVGAVANGPNPFAQAPGAEPNAEAIVPALTPREIVRA
jgi:hypothetical protein